MYSFRGKWHWVVFIEFPEKTRKVNFIHGFYPAFSKMPGKIHE
jgi:hypothetical protein